MFLKRVCLFLSAALLVVNLFLGGLYLKANRDVSVLSADFLQNAVHYLKSQNVEIQQDVLAKRIPNNPVYTFTKSNEECAEIVAPILAQHYAPQKSVSVVETPDGFAYSAVSEEGSTYTLRVYRDSFWFEFSTDGVTPAFGTEAFENSMTDLAKDYRKTVNRFLKFLSPNAKNSMHKIVGVVDSSDGVYVCCEQQADKKKKIKNMYINLLIKNGDVAYACGNYVFDSLKKSYSQPLVDGVNAVKSMDLENIKEILSENIVYALRNAESGVYYLIPIWEVQYLDIEKHTGTQYVDAFKK